MVRNKEVEILSFAKNLAYVIIAGGCLGLFLLFLIAVGLIGW